MVFKTKNKHHSTFLLQEVTQVVCTKPLNVERRYIKCL